MGNNPNDSWLLECDPHPVLITIFVDIYNYRYISLQFATHRYFNIWGYLQIVFYF